VCAVEERKLGAVFDHGLERRFEFLFDGVAGIHWMEARVVPERNAAGKVVTILEVRLTTRLRLLHALDLPPAELLKGVRQPR
jgi:hypothetical protein